MAVRANKRKTHFNLFVSIWNILYGTQISYCLVQINWEPNVELANIMLRSKHITLTKYFFHQLVNLKLKEMTTFTFVYSKLSLLSLHLLNYYEFPNSIEMQMFVYIVCFLHVPSSFVTNFLVFFLFPFFFFGESCISFSLKKKNKC